MLCKIKLPELVYREKPAIVGDPALVTLVNLVLYVVVLVTVKANDNTIG